MQFTQYVHHLPLIALLVCAAIEDARRRRVSNWLTLSLLASGLALSFTPWGAPSPAEAMLGAAGGFAGGLFLFAMRLAGGADGKLLIGIGAWLGPWGLALVFAAASILAMVMAIGQSLIAGRLPALLRDSALLLIDLVVLRRRPAPIPVGREPAPVPVLPSHSKFNTIPYAVALLFATAGVIIAQSLQGRWGG